jgi:hypothetical protein
MEPRAGFEPATQLFREVCSAVELTEREEASDAMLDETYVWSFVMVSVIG